MTDSEREELLLEARLSRPGRGSVDDGLAGAIALAMLVAFAVLAFAWLQNRSDDARHAESAQALERALSESDRAQAQADVRGAAADETLAPPAVSIELQHCEVLSPEERARLEAVGVTCVTPAAAVE